MPRMTVYLDAEAYAFVKEKTPGYIGRLVREQMPKAPIQQVQPYVPDYEEPFQEAP